MRTIFEDRCIKYCQSVFVEEMQRYLLYLKYTTFFKRIDVLYIVKTKKNAMVLTIFER